MDDREISLKNLSLLEAFIEEVGGLLGIVVAFLEEKTDWQGGVTVVEGKPLVMLSPLQPPLVWLATGAHLMGHAVVWRAFKSQSLSIWRKENTCLDPLCTDTFWLEQERLASLWAYELLLGAQGFFGDVDVLEEKTLRRALGLRSEQPTTWEEYFSERNEGTCPLHPRAILQALWDSPLYDLLLDSGAVKFVPERRGRQELT